MWKYDVTRYGITFIVLFCVIKMFNVFVYQTDGISVLFGLCLLTISIVLNILFKNIFYKLYLSIEMKKRIKELDRIIEEWRDFYEDDSE